MQVDPRFPKLPLLSELCQLYTYTFVNWRTRDAATPGYEDDITTPGHPFAAGITVARLAAITVDERGVESFVSSDSFSRVRKRWGCTSGIQFTHIA